MNSVTNEKASNKGLNISANTLITQVRAYNELMYSLRWKVITVNIPSSTKEWMLSVVLPLTFVILANFTFSILGLA
jgi:hypothetical protein